MSVLGAIGLLVGLAAIFCFAFFVEASVEWLFSFKFVRVFTVVGPCLLCLGLALMYDSGVLFLVGIILAGWAWAVRSEGGLD